MIMYSGVVRITVHSFSWCVVWCPERGRRGGGPDWQSATSSPRCGGPPPAMSCGRGCLRNGGCVCLAARGRDQGLSVGKLFKISAKLKVNFRKAEVKSKSAMCVVEVNRSHEQHSNRHNSTPMHTENFDMEMRE